MGSHPLMWYYDSRRNDAVRMVLCSRPFGILFIAAFSSRQTCGILSIVMLYIKSSCGSWQIQDWGDERRDLAEELPVVLFR